MQQLVNLAEKLKKLETNGPDYTALWRLRLCAFIAIAALVAIAILFPPAVLLVVAASIVLVLLVGDSRRDWKIEERHELHKNELKAVKTVLMSHPFFEQKETGSVNETDSNENKFECPGNE